MFWIWILGRKYPKIKNIKILWFIPVVFWICFWVINLISAIQSNSPSGIRYLVEVMPLFNIIVLVGEAMIYILPMIVGIVISFESVESQSTKINKNISFNSLINLYLIFAFLSVLCIQMSYFVIMILISIAILIRMIQGNNPYKQILSFLLINMTLMIITKIHIMQISSFEVVPFSGMLLSGIIGCVFLILSERYYLCKLHKFEQILVFSGIFLIIYIIGIIFTLFILLYGLFR